MILHNLKGAVRNLMKYRLQTLISVLSIAIGIVTLIAVVVVWNIRSTMRTNPSEIIAKE